jgi:hypothetical protein
VLLLGAMAAGILTGDAGKAAMKPFSGDLFKGMLAFFLLDMGLMAARNLTQLRGKSPLVLAYAIFGPIAHAAAAVALAAALKLQPGDGGLLMVLAASASYIAVPAVLRHAIPEANPSMYLANIYANRLHHTLECVLAREYKVNGKAINDTHSPVLKNQRIPQKKKGAAYHSGKKHQPDL